MTTETLPPTRGTSCFDCPWRRNATAGWLGPYDAMTWVRLAHGEAPIACHITLPEEGEDGDWEAEGILQCRGVAVYRENVCKVPKHPDIETGPGNRETHFARPDEFVGHHGGEMEVLV